ncbi:DNA-packaging protein [Sphingomonas sp. DT-51]|uniref:DNA-packaging protein n=1 Tax=Sphingomonas sp. DT-51 TaxID=3396165 RepID=UPI003F1A68A3
MTRARIPPLTCSLRVLRDHVPAQAAPVAAALDEATLRRLLDDWASWAHPGQLAPHGDWRVWLIQAGRGFGKTRAGAEWVCAMARAQPRARIALVGATLDDAHQVMVEGPSGVLAVARAGEPVVWRATAGELRFAGGAVAHVYSAAAPETLRGPEHQFAWADELGKWRGAAAWDNLMLGLRLGAAPRALVTTTPRPTALLRRVAAAPDTRVARGRTSDNPHLPAAFVAAVEQAYGGTRLGRQELDGELVEEVAGALWPRALIERQRAATLPALVRVVVGVDPPAGSDGDACGIVAAALGRDGHGYVLEDASVTQASPERWARAVAACAARHAAERVVAEANQGGAMVAQVLRAAEAALPLRLVHATRGKAARAEPVAALYEAGRVWHARAFPALEDELAGLVAGGGYEGPGRSPDRADACVWALTALLLEGAGAVRVRVV